MEDIREQLRCWYGNIPNMFKGCFRKKWIRALQRKGMRAAVDAKCQDCTNWQNAEIRRCNNATCPLFQYRPFADRNGQLENEVIAVVSEIEANQQKCLV